MTTEVQSPSKRRVGRPRTVSFEPEEMIELGQRMLDWVYENDPLHISQWYSGHMCISYKDFETMQKRPEFIGYYEQAMLFIGLKYLDKNSCIREGVSQRWQRVYFKDLRQEEDETKRYESSLKADESNKVSDDVVKGFTAVMNQLKKDQEDSESEK